MKIETKICLYFMAPLLISVLLLFVNLFYKQSESLRHNYTENCKKQTSSLADSYKEALAGRNLDHIHNTISRLKYQKDIVKAIISEYPSQNKLVSIVKDKFSEIYRIKALILKIKGERLSYKEYIDTSTSKVIFPATAPILISNKKLATLTIFFDESHLLQQTDDLKRELILKGFLVFVVCVVLIFAAGKIIARSYSKLFNKSLATQPIDVFDLPELTLDTIVNIKKDTDINHYRFSRAEEEIISLISSEKHIRNILKESPLDEILTFELVSRFVTRGILEIR